MSTTVVYSFVGADASGGIRVPATGGGPGDPA